MKRLLSIATILTLLLVSCQQPQEVELKPEEVDNQLVVKSIAEADTGLVLNPVDSSGVLPSDQYRYEGMFLISSLRYDLGQDVVRASTFSVVYFSNRQKPIVYRGRIIGYEGLDRGIVTLNGSPMPRISHNIALPWSNIDTIAGYKYGKDLTLTHTPNATYTWVVSPLSAASLTVSIDSPGDVKVTSPRGGSILSRNQDLVLQWTGKGNMSIVISMIDPVSKAHKPVLNILPGPFREKAVLSSKVLRLLPPNRVYVFTFSVSNRKELANTSSYSGGILVQAASVYNSYVELR
jgi:hypothetical protein